MKLTKKIKLLSIMLITMVVILGFIQKVNAEEINYEDIESIDYTPKNSYEYVEETGGGFIENEPKYYKYYYSKQEGDILTVNYTQESGKGTKTYEYTYDEENGNSYRSKDGEIIESNEVILEDSQDVENWTTNKKNYITVKYKNKTVQKEVIIKENPVDKIEVRKKKQIEFYEGTNGDYQTDTVWNPETQKDEKKTYFRYRYNAFELGDILIVNETEYEYKEFYNEEEDYYYNAFCSASGDIISNDEVYTGDEQFQNEWTINGTNRIIVYYMGRKTDILVTIKENPVNSINYITNHKYEFVENTNGIFKNISKWNDETNEEDEIQIFYYEWNKPFRLGDILVVNDTEYECKWMHNEEEDWYDLYFCSESGDIIDYNEIDVSDNQEEINGWKIGADNKIIIKYMGKEASIPVTIKKNTVQSIEYKPVNDGYKFIENINGYYDKDEGFFYYDDFHQIGNTLIVHSEEGTKTYKFYYENGEYEETGYYTEDGKDFISLNDINIIEDQNNNHWEKGKEYSVTVEYLGKSVDVPVKIISNDVESIEYEVASPYEIKENTEGYWEDIDGDGKQDEYIYEYELKDGDKLKVTKTDKTIETYEYKTDKDINKCGLYKGNDFAIHIYDGNVFYYDDEQYDGKLWTIGSDNYFTIHYKGKEAKVNVTILSDCNHEKTELKNKKNATCSSEGYTGDTICTECGRTIKTGTKTAKLAHTPKTAVKENEKIATCSEEGSYDEVVYCSVCNEIISKTTKKTAKLAHNYKTTTTPATLNKDGSIVEKCSVCGEVKSNITIPYPKTIDLSKNSFTYNNKVQKPTVTVKDSKGNVIASSNYTITYSNNDSKNVGEYNITITFNGNYTGTKTLNYTINPKGTSLKKLTAGKKQFKMTWNKQKTQTTGYEIQYSTNKKFKKGNKTVKIKKNKTTSKTVKKLKAKKKYYVRIRTYKKVNGKTYYSGWSKVKNIKTKK